MLRTTQSQNLMLRWVHEKELPSLHRKLSDLGLAETPPPLLKNMVACAGASTCQLGICLSRALARAIVRALNRDGLNLSALGELRIYINGCPNACGRHPIADIALHGAARRVGGHLAPFYVIQLGGRLGEEETRLAEGKATIPARNVPAFLKEFLSEYQSSPELPNFERFLEARGRELANRLADRYRHMPSFDEDKNYYFDWDAEEIFSLAGRGPGECSAGVFDLIEVDLRSSREALERGELYSASVLASRALLITQGQEAKADAPALHLFTNYFIDQRLIKEEFRALVDEALRCAELPNPERAFKGEPKLVEELLQAVRRFYETMDDSLRFRPVGVEQSHASPPPPSDDELKVDYTADFRGVARPLNYVKTKLQLARMSTGQILSVLLDEEGARNVPASAEQDGHKVLQVKKLPDHRRVIIQKGT